MDKHKQVLLDTLKGAIAKVQKSFGLETKKLNDLINKPLSEIKSMLPEDQMVYANMKYHAENRIGELEHLNASPFFVKCKIGEKEFYFAKHHFTEEQIYSWVAPIATVRFEKPGPIEYRLPDGKIEKAILEHKEQYLIVDGKVVFFAIEDLKNPRELIYQEHFSVKKEGFVLPEIVEVMEKAQDAVIRAHHIGPFIISGPAGSGKTTLALHRVAFLVQAPDTAHLYPGETIIVFVQDNGTKEYFSHLLPELGIKNVKITTFFEWAIEILGIPDAHYIDTRGDEYQRLKQQVPLWSETKKFLTQNKKTGLDRIDLTFALRSFYNHHERFEIKTKYTTVVKGEYKEKTRTTVPNYSLMVIDEFQNYMPEQINLLNTCLDEQTKSIIYVGDIAQQIVPGALRSWDSIGLKMNSEREVRLHKVYRNTKQILSYIKSLGYKVEIPDQIKEGSEVQEKQMVSEKEIISYIENLVKTKQGIIGVISHETKSLQDHFKNKKRVHVTTMAGSQGVEFDTVCIVGIDKDFFEIKDSENLEERKRIQKDLLYVALTRAINELHIIGTSKLSTITVIE